MGSFFLDPDTIVAIGAEVEEKSSPRPRNLPTTLRVLMMENRSFDHYFGWLPGADGSSGTAVRRQGRPDDPTHRLNDDFQGCGPADPDHSFGGAHTVDNGKMDASCVGARAFLDRLLRGGRLRSSRGGEGVHAFDRSSAR